MKRCLIVARDLKRTFKRKKNKRDEEVEVCGRVITTHP